MLRRSLLTLKAQRCLYETLGVPRTASSEDIKRSFRERAKQTHPDAKTGGTAGGDASRGFRDLVEAYRVLRDPAQRRKYDAQAARDSQSAQYGPSWASRGPGGMGSETMRDAQHGYSAGSQPGAATGSFGSRISSGEQAAIAAVLGGAMIYLATKGNPAEYRDPDPYPSKRPQSLASVNSIGGAGPHQSAVARRPAVLQEPAPVAIPEAVAAQSEMPVQQVAASQPAGVVIPASIGKVSDPNATMFAQEQPTDELVRAFYNPYADRWMRIPEGYEPPAAMDLTAWHKKRTDPAEWARLFAEGKLSEIMPRGGLKTRYLPAWETYDAMIVWDPFTGKTVSVNDQLPKRRPGQKQVCEVRF